MKKLYEIKMKQKSLCCCNIEDFVPCEGRRKVLRFGDDQAVEKAGASWDRQLSVGSSYQTREGHTREREEREETTTRLRSPPPLHKHALDSDSMPS